MTIETSLSRGQECYILAENRVQWCYVDEIRVHVTGNAPIDIRYLVQSHDTECTVGGMWFDSAEVFATKQELLDSL